MWRRQKKKWKISTRINRLILLKKNTIFNNNHRKKKMKEMKEMKKKLFRLKEKDAK